MGATMAHKLIDHGDGTGSYRGWGLKQGRCGWPGCTVLAWYAECPHETEDFGFALATAAGFQTTNIRAQGLRDRQATFGRHTNGAPHQPWICRTIEDCIDAWEDARDRQLAIAFSGVDDGRVGVRVERPEERKQAS